MTHRMYAVVDRAIGQTIAMHAAESDETAKKMIIKFLKEANKTMVDPIRTIFVNRIGIYDAEKGYFIELNNERVFDSEGDEDYEAEILHSMGQTTAETDGTGKPVEENVPAEAR